MVTEEFHDDQDTLSIYFHAVTTPESDKYLSDTTLLPGEYAKRYSGYRTDLLDRLKVPIGFVISDRLSGLIEDVQGSTTNIDREGSPINAVLIEPGGELVQSPQAILMGLTATAQDEAEYCMSKRFEELGFVVHVIIYPDEESEHGWSVSGIVIEDLMKDSSILDAEIKELGAKDDKDEKDEMRMRLKKTAYYLITGEEID